MAKARRSLTPALGASLALHAGLLVFLLIWTGLRPDRVSTKPAPMRTDLIFMERSGAAGGGGGNSTPARPHPVEIPVHDLPAVPTMAVSLQPPVEPPKPLFDAPVQTNNAVMLQGGGVNLLAPPGPGGTGPGTGIGPGKGPGLGPGEGGNTGGGPRRIGDGVTSPIPIKPVSPTYTNEAMRARISGTAIVECTVLADGTVTDAKIVSSLDRVFGLDQEAIKTALKWTFKPGTFEGKPVDVIVRIALQFNLR
jgi:protein TonB